MSDVFTPEQVADQFKISRRQVIQLAHDNKWPCLRISKKRIRFTDAHIAQIEELTSSGPSQNVINLHGRISRRRA